jgi:hypothetical protein
MRRVKVQTLVSALLLNTACAHTSASGLCSNLGFEVATWWRSQYSQWQHTWRSKKCLRCCFKILTFYGWFLLSVNEVSRLFVSNVSSFRGVTPLQAAEMLRQKVFWRRRKHPTETNCLHSELNGLNGLNGVAHFQHTLKYLKYPTCSTHKSCKISQFIAFWASLFGELRK